MSSKSFTVTKCCLPQITLPMWMLCYSLMSIGNVLIRGALFSHTHARTHTQITTWFLQQQPPPCPSLTLSKPLTPLSLYSIILSSFSLLSLQKSIETQSVFRMLAVYCMCKCVQATVKMQLCPSSLSTTIYKVYSSNCNEWMRKMRHKSVQLQYHLICSNLYVHTHMLTNVSVSSTYSTGHPVTNIP